LGLASWAAQVTEEAASAMHTVKIINTARMFWRKFIVLLYGMPAFLPD